MPRPQERAAVAAEDAKLAERLRAEELLEAGRLTAMHDKDRALAEKMQREEFSDFETLLRPIVALWCARTGAVLRWRGAAPERLWCAAGKHQRWRP